jgi:predicted nucleotide-binding protein
LRQRCDAFAAEPSGIIRNIASELDRGPNCGKETVVEQADEIIDSGQENGKHREASGPGFPKTSLETALRVPDALEQASAGNPLPPIETAKALEYSPGSSGFRTILAASHRYGLTRGSYKSSRISMQELGTRVTAPRTPEDRAEALVAAALAPQTFRQLFDYYKGKKLPDPQYIANTAVREFGVPKAQAHTCVEIFRQNMEFVGLVSDTKGGDWLSAEAAPSLDVAVRRATGPEGDDDHGHLGDQDDRDDESDRQPVDQRPPRSNAIFIGARKGKARTQLTKTLDGLGIPYKVAEDEPNLARPISRKVQETMEGCGAGILIFTADEEYRAKDDDKAVWKPSDNVVHELGAASVLYDNRIIVFKEESVELATNYSDIGYIEFEQDHLDAKVNDLLKELFAFKIIAVQVGG